jgi:hypothetical protein
MKTVDIVHKQLTHTVVLLIEFIRNTLSQEAEAAKNKKQVFILA